MAIDLTNPFVYTPLEERSVLESKIFNPIQLIGLQNQRAEIANQLIRLNYEPNNHIDFALQQSFLRGQLELLDFLLESSGISSQELLNLVQRQSGQQGQNQSGE